MNLKERTSLWYLSLLRIYVGYHLAAQGIKKFQRDFPKGDWIGRQIGDIADLNIYPWYKKLLLAYVVPYHELFGYLVMTGEIVIGVCLLVGLLTRMSASIGLFMMTNYYLAVGMARGGTISAHQEIFIVALAIILFANAGRTLGLDGLLFSGGKGRGPR